MLGKPFQPGADARRNTVGRPKKVRSVADVVTPDDVEKIAASMRVQALAGDPTAAQAIAILLMASK